MKLSDLKNIGSVDRIVRIVLGIVGIAVIVFVPSAWRWVGLVGVVLLATTFVSVCPIYLALGIRTNKKDK